MASKVWLSKACFNIYVRDALVTGFAERKEGKKKYYDFAVEVLWSDGRKTYVKRTYKDFLYLRESLSKYGGRTRKYSGDTADGNIPNLEGLKLFTPGGIEQAERQELELNRFIQTLAKTRGELMFSRDIVEFFEARPGDPVPYHQRSNIDDFSEMDSVALEDEVVFDAGKWTRSQPENVSLLMKDKPR